MGYGSYSSSDWDRLRKQKNINDSSSLSDLYKATSIDPKYDPKNIKFRESRDSKDNPISTPIIFGLDVTGSMGYLSTEIAKEHLNKTMLELYDKKPVMGPQILFAAIDDSKPGVMAAGPLQVTQFESDIRIAEQLMDLWFVGRGYGNGGESYNLVWWFALNHTKTDCDEKRHEKGIIFTIGDEPCHLSLESFEIEDVFGDSAQETIFSDDLYKKVSEKYDTYHICVDPARALDSWNRIMPGHVIPLAKENIKYLSEVITAVIRISRGENKKDVIAGFEGDVQNILTKSLKGFKR